MLKKKATSVALIVALLSILLLVEYSVTIAQSPPGSEYDWETVVIGSPEGMGIWMMFSDFNAENFHFGIELPTGGPGSPTIELTFDVENLETSSPDPTPPYTSAVRLEAENVLFTIQPSEPLDSAPIEVEIAADELVMDMAMGPPDGDTGQFGELTFELADSVAFQFDLDPFPDWWNPPDPFSNEEFSGRVVFLQPDYEISFVYEDDPEPFQMYPSCEWGPSERIDLEVHVEPTRFYDIDGDEVDEPVADYVFLNLWGHGELEVDPDQTMQKPPFTWPVTVRNHAGHIPEEPFEITAQIRTGDGQQWENKLPVVVVPRYEYNVYGPLDPNIDPSEHEGDWQFGEELLVVEVTPNDIPWCTPGPQPVGLHWDPRDGLQAMLFEVVWVVDHYELVLDGDGQPVPLEDFEWGGNWGEIPGPLTPPFIGAVGFDTTHIEHWRPRDFQSWIHFHDECCYGSEANPEAPFPSIELYIRVEGHYDGYLLPYDVPGGEDPIIEALPVGEEYVCNLEFHKRIDCGPAEATFHFQEEGGLMATFWLSTESGPVWIPWGMPIPIPEDPGDHIVAEVILYATSLTDPGDYTVAVNIVDSNYGEEYWFPVWVTVVANGS